jgi:hypothetical protein
MRRETQLPVLSSKAKSKWQELQQRLLQPPTTTAERICEKDAADLSAYPWFEREKTPQLQLKDLQAHGKLWNHALGSDWLRVLETTNGDFRIHTEPA